MKRPGTDNESSWLVKIFITITYTELASYLSYSMNVIGTST